jgi:hypothetical protein
MREDLTRARTQGRSMPHSFRLFLYTLIAKRCIFDVWPGLLYVLQRTMAKTMIAAELVNRKLGLSPSVTVDEPHTDGVAVAKQQ